ncbi:MAG: ABC transporter ATP-binding protein [Candidatus Alcyoniella australis]|nr:ABC transporter ATP-binding protein [Candidatus Alcyoniella australis]
MPRPNSAISTPADSRPQTLRIRRLTTELRSQGGLLSIVDNVSLSIERGCALGLVGESGCGKSLLARSALGLLPRRLFKVSGSVRLGQSELIGMPRRQLRKVLGSRAAMIFQEPAAAMDPVYPAGDAAYEVLRRHGGLGRVDSRRRVAELFAQVGIDDPLKRAAQIPSRLSGGMRQRALIASTLAADVELLVADEPTTALDVTIQAQILALLNRLRRDRGTSLLLITHDLGVVAATCQRVAVMYAGRIVEHGAVGEIFSRPAHPYTRLLLKALHATQQRDIQRLEGIPGNVPDPSDYPTGCRFHPRCPERFAVCDSQVPQQLPIPGRNGWAACHLYDSSLRGKS